MLNHTRKIKEIYEDIQRKLFYMIPEKWEDLYLYSSVLDKPDKEGKTGEPHTAHTTNPVPIILVTSNKNVKLKENGKLADLAPTMLDLMNLEKPEEMTGVSLLDKE